MALHQKSNPNSTRLSDTDGYHARESQSPARQIELPAPFTGILRQTLLALSRRRTLGAMALRWPPARRLAYRFVAGHNLGDAISAVQRLNDLETMATLDHLGENVETAAEAFVAAGAYVDALEAIRVSGVRANVSLKLTQMGLDIDSRLCHENVARIVERAHQHQNFVRIDMEGSAYTQRTLDIFRQLYSNHRNVGVVIQSYLYRSQADVEEMIALKARVRLCKGAYDEPASIAYRARADVDSNFRRLAERLLLAGTYPAFATHDERLIRWTCHFASEHEISPDRFEFQFLYGIRRDLQERLVAEGYNVRVYVPYGRDWYRYFMRRLAERPANLLFLLTNLGKG